MSVCFCFLKNTEHRVIMPQTALMHQNGGFPLQKIAPKCPSEQAKTIRIIRFYFVETRKYVLVDIIVCKSRSKPQIIPNSEHWH